MKAQRVLELNMNHSAVKAMESAVQTDIEKQRSTQSFSTIRLSLLQDFRLKILANMQILFAVLWCN